MKLTTTSFRVKETFWANLINALAAFLKPACILIFSGAFFEFYKKVKRLDVLPGAQKSFQPYGLI